MANTLHVSIAAEELTKIGPLSITNSTFTSLIVTAFLIIVAFTFASTKKKQKPTGFQNLVEIIIEGLFNLTKDISGEKKARIFFPFIASSFLFILFNNWFGLFPGVGPITLKHQTDESSDHALLPQAIASDDLVVEDDHQTATEDSHQQQTDTESTHTTEGEHASQEEAHHPAATPIFRAATADLNTTLALAIISVFLTQYWGIKYLGLSYFKKFFNFSDGPIFTFVGLLELVSEFAKIISFAFRLFGNIFAGEVLLVVIAALSPKFLPILPLPFYGLEVFVGLIQALVFAMLSLVFINMATTSHDH